MKKTLLLAFALCSLMAGIAAAQEDIDVVYLKNGDVIKGVITEGATIRTPSAYFKIQTSNGSVITVQYVDVARFDKEKAAPPPAPPAPPVEPPPAAPEPQVPYQPAQPQRAPISYRSSHEWVDYDLGFRMGFLIGNNDKLKQLWTQAVPAPTEIPWDDKHNHVGMGLDLDLMLRPNDRFSLGPFLGFNFLAPGASGELTWSGTTTYHTKHILSMMNLTYGGRLRGLFPIRDAAGAEAANLSLELSVGSLTLAGAGYRVLLDDKLVQQSDFSGSAMYYSAAAGVSASFSRMTALSARFGWQSASLDEITFKIVQDDYSPGDVGRTGTLRDARNLSKITANLGEIYMCIALTLMI